MAEKIVSNFEDIFSGYPKGIYGLIKQALNKYAGTKRGKARMDMFLAGKSFQVEEGYVHGESGYFEIVSRQFIADEFVPLAVMFIEIEFKQAKIKISAGG